ncbi:hypothetical protein [Arsenicicoccus dermatophilus]|uniref:hypothetical protein n=1 Tax=Arsenicicoccus dermatophilus TaxID=1076331 RepID=UPI001F4C8FF9|nr:hypothetical protein [Arsenicicoccus dermatophilus]MCH8612267.1 hypothetical protein [Arsenicicoccus dermatophilus]
MEGNRWAGKVLAIVIVLMVLGPLILLSVVKPSDWALPTIAFVLTGVYVWLHNRNQARRG